MKTIKGLEKICQPQIKRLTIDKLAQLAVADLADCYCLIYGENKQEQAVLLAKLDLLTESIYYDQFDKRIDLCVAGKIINTEHVPLHYCLQGQQLAIMGRCSMLPKICGVDLYLQASYTGVVGDIARQNFSIPIKPLLDLVKLNWS